MTGPDLAGIRACVFDAYGTLLDLAAAGRRCAEILGDKADRVNEVWRTKQISWTWHLNSMGVYRDFWRITEDSLDVALHDSGIWSESGRARLLAQYRVLDPYPDVAPALERLRGAGLRTAVLSNGTEEMVRVALGAGRLTGLVDAVCSADHARVFKPHPNVYRLACDALGEPAHALCFVSSNYWDVAGASIFGFPTVWLNRTGQRPEPLPGRPTATIASLSELPGLLA
jgi:2-haloacid dehalogenase